MQFWSLLLAKLMYLLCLANIKQGINLSKWPWLKPEDGLVLSDDGYVGHLR